MIIGTFTYEPKADTYRGSIVTLTAARSEVFIRPNMKSAEREPDYRVIHESDGCEVELGAAWKRTSDNTGPFLSVVLDDPALAAPLSTALFADKHSPNVARLAWTRPRARPAKPETATAEQPPARPEVKPQRQPQRRKPQNG